MTKRLLKSLKTAHAGNAAITILQDEECLVVEPSTTEWRVFLGFDAHVQIVLGADLINEFDVNDPGDDDCDWYHHRLLTAPEEYAQQLLDETGVTQEYAEKQFAKPLRHRIDRHCVRSVSEDDGDFRVVAEFDGVVSHLSIAHVDRDGAIEVALCGLRLDYIRREIGRGTATAADVRVAIGDAGILGVGYKDVSDLIDAFMLPATEDEAAHRANPRPVLVDATFTLSRDQLTNALREAAAQGMDRTSGPSCEQAASCREVADEIIEAIEAGRFSPDDYGYRVEDERRAS